jgi:hypothetical protein
MHDNNWRSDQQGSNLWEENVPDSTPSVLCLAQHAAPSVLCLAPPLPASACLRNVEVRNIEN